MRVVLLLAAGCLAASLSGCAAMAEAIRQQQLAEEQLLEAKVASLQPGQPAEGVLRVWGQPDDETFHSSSLGTIQLWRYGRCATARYVTVKVLTVTIINGKVDSWSTFDC